MKHVLALALLLGGCVQTPTEYVAEQHRLHPQNYLPDGPIACAHHTPAGWVSDCSMKDLPGPAWDRYGLYRIGQDPRTALDLPSYRPSEPPTVVIVPVPVVIEPDYEPECRVSVQQTQRQSPCCAPVRDRAKFELHLQGPSCGYTVVPVLSAPDSDPT